MDTLHTVLNRGCSLWDQARLPKEEFQRRLDRVREGMRERGVDLLLVYGDSWRFGQDARRRYWRAVRGVRDWRLFQNRR